MQPFEITLRKTESSLKALKSRSQISMREKKRKNIDSFIIPLHSCCFLAEEGWYNKIEFGKA